MPIGKSIHWQNSGQTLWGNTARRYVIKATNKRAWKKQAYVNRSTDNDLPAEYIKIKL